MAVTIRNIAEYTGLSKPTVTRILGKDAHLFGADTRQRVYQAAEKLGYRRNAAARAIGTGRFGCAALVMSCDYARSDLPMGLLYGVQEELGRCDMHLTVERLPDKKLTAEGFVPKVLRESMCDGMLINYTHEIPRKMLELIRAHHAPAIWINTKLDSDCVYPDDLGAIRQLTQHLLAMGHRRIAYAKFDWASHYSTADRLAGYEQVMNEAGLVPQSISRPVPADELLDLTRSMLTAPDRPTAVIVRPEDAHVFLSVAAGLGLQVPRDLSIASVTGKRFDLLGLRVTSVVVPAEEEGRQAVRMVNQKIEDPHAALPPCAVKFEFEPGRTCVPPVM
jgi:LacI family transcriptional regulator